MRFHFCKQIFAFVSVTIHLMLQLFTTSSPQPYPTSERHHASPPQRGARAALTVPPAAPAASTLARGLHSFTFHLHLSRFCD